MIYSLFSCDNCSSQYESIRESCTLRIMLRDMFAGRSGQKVPRYLASLVLVNENEKYKQNCNHGELGCRIRNSQWICRIQIVRVFKVRFMLSRQAENVSTPFLFPALIPMFGEGHPETPFFQVKFENIMPILFQWGSVTGFLSF